MTDHFDDIRPYYDSEINAAMRRIAANDAFPVIASFIYPGADFDALREELRHISTTDEFQSKVMSVLNEQIIQRTMTEFTYGGLNYIDPHRAYLYVSNHRDIMLDASLLQQLLHLNGYPTTEITFGANLMSSPLVVDIGKSNKMFRVDRPGNNPRDFYRSSLHLSEYIRHAIIEKGNSVWIAQRNGRTKDGFDRTDQGIIKMLGMSFPDDKIRAIDELNIVPMSISYEWESCDILKALERYESRFEKYIKKPGEDLNSILTGIRQYKGRVHIQLCEPLRRNELERYADLTTSMFDIRVAQLIDSRIRPAYRLYPNNYIAHDMLYGNTDCRDHYTEEDKLAFTRRLDKLSEYDVEQPALLRDIFLGIYANPINNENIR
jgi:hypothetical protein